ncbi:hypothetical protein DN820_10790 [Stutzerimonas nosocomialis]|uniref:Uncharacterized protein n=1 Tax=Stutzerimonas nosocomialis TaxID=1056496 RepID=A0A5R9QEQ7_9GAMM|nr:hypothetical protein DN820_10790 [Stutzerimonas nosocomialis]
MPSKRPCRSARAARRASRRSAEPPFPRRTSRHPWRAPPLFLDLRQYRHPPGGGAARALTRVNFRRPFSVYLAPIETLQPQENGICTSMRWYSQGWSRSA